MAYSYIMLFLALAPFYARRKPCIEYHVSITLINIYSYISWICVIYIPFIYRAVYSYCICRVKSGQFAMLESCEKWLFFLYRKISRLLCLADLWKFGNLAYLQRNHTGGSSALTWRIASNQTQQLASCPGLHFYTNMIPLPGALQSIE